MGIINDFKQFALKGNVVDLAVAVVIGGVFGKIVTSLVNDVIMPPIGLLLGGVDFSELKIVMKKAAEGADAVTLNYGSFINTIVDFLIIAGAVFMLVKVLNKTKKKEAPAPPPPAPAPTKEEILLTEIRDLLAQQKK